MSPIGFQSKMFWGFISQDEVLKVEVPNVGFEPFTPQKDALGFEFSPSVGHHTRGGVYGKIVSHLLLPTLIWFSFYVPNVWSSLSKSLGFFLRGKCSIYSCKLSVSFGRR